MSAAIAIQHVSKVYRLGILRGATLNEDVERWWARVRRKPDPFLKIGEEEHQRKLGQFFWALNDVNFEVKEGEVVGVIGRNGAGKSTLLKILSQVTAPSSGRIEIRGRVASLLEVGTGFHPDLTGRENIFLNGAILGMTKAEIRRNLDDIVAFAECDAFIDTPVKRYSSGMYVRLAFAVAAHLEPEILIVDEVLAVGDAQFQRKCLTKMSDVARKGRTILFVSHSMAAIMALCTRAILLEDGRLRADGTPATVATTYQAQTVGVHGDKPRLIDLPRRGTGKGRFTSLEIVPFDPFGEPARFAVTGGDVLVSTTVECFSDIRAANVGVELYDAGGYRLVDACLSIHGQYLSLQAGESAVISFRFKELLLKPGSYRLGAWLGRAGMEDIDYLEFAARIDIHENVSFITQSETFPGVYQCRFSTSVNVNKLTHNAQG